MNVQKVLWRSEERGVAYERVDTGGPFGGMDTPEYLGMNPKGLVPTVSDGGFSLWESNAIVRYLCARYGEVTMWTADSAGRALADRWMDFQFGTPWPAFRVGFLGLTRTPPERRDPDAMQASLNSTARSLSALDAHLAETEYVAGDPLTMGDLALGSMVYRWLNIDIERPPLLNLEAWHERLTEERHGPVHADLSARSATTTRRRRSGCRRRGCGLRGAT